MLCEDRPVSPAGARSAPLPVRVIVPGLLTTVTAAVLAAAAYGGRPVLAVAVFPVQLVLVLSWLAALAVPSRRGAVVVALGAAVVANIVAVPGDRGLSRLAGVVGVSLLIALVHQLVRRDGRAGVTASLVGTVGAVALVVGAAVLVALRKGDEGTDAVETSLAALAASIVVARVVDAVVVVPSIATSDRRGWPGFVLGLAAGVAFGAIVGSARGLDGSSSAVLGGVVALVALAFELGTDLARLVVPRVRATRGERAALIPLSVFLPVCAIGPAAYVAGRILFG